jgi:hypothetical protein
VSKEAATTARIYGKTSEEIMEDFRSFYFDLALSSSEAVLKLVLDAIPHDHLLYGKLLSKPAMSWFGSVADAFRRF